MVRGNRPAAYWEEGREAYPDYEDNPVKQVALEPVSTFSIDVDTASYSRVRRFLNDGQHAAGRFGAHRGTGQLFQIRLRASQNRETPFKSDIALFDAPWDDGTQILRIGLKGFDIPAEQRPPANLVFLVDTSGSMNSPDKLPLLQKSLRMLVAGNGAGGSRGDGRLCRFRRRDSGAHRGQTQIEDPVGHRRYAGRRQHRRRRRHPAGLPPGPGQYREGAVNRVILATDGDFNVGYQRPGPLET